MAANSLKEEIQGVVFKFSEFDIESLEEAFLLDEEGLSTDTRSSLILDTLICLLRGITGRREVSLNNYNRYFYRLMANYWEALGFGPNPFGPDITKANYHRLPLYARVKLMYALCELRLTRNDVEHALREFSGDSMRVIHLGEDRNGVTYWYFYGTRLYAEDPEIKITIPLRHGDKKKLKNEIIESDNDDVQVDTSSKSVRTRKRKRKGRAYDFGLSRKKRKCSKKAPSSKKRNLADQNGTSKSAPLDETEKDEEPAPAEASAAASSVSQEELIREEDEEDEDLGLRRNGTASSLGLLANEIYSAHEASSDEERDSFKEFKSGICSPSSSCNQSWFAGDAEKLQNVTELKSDETASHTGSESKASANVSDGTNEIKDSPGGASQACPADRTVEAAPWLDQPFLKPPTRRRWRVRCDTLDDWKNLVESLKGSTFAKERRLYDLLQNSFLPEIEKFYEQKQAEKQQRESEMVRRLSERLETRRSLRERAPPPIFHDFFYSGDEEELEYPVSEERRRQLDIERREQRYRMRALEKEKQEKLRERAREERARRMEIRKRRQEGDSAILNDGILLNDKSLNELDIQLELEFMYGQLEKLLYALKENSDAWPFAQPVTEDIAPNYFQFIKRPMDLGTIETKLMSREYKNKLEFIEDVNLMLLNCLEYNGLRNDYTKVAQRLERSFIRLWKRYFPPSQSGDEDSGLNCVALLGALDAKIKEKIREEINLMKRNAVPSSSSRYTASHPQKVPEAKLLGISPQGRILFRDKVLQPLVRNVPLPIAQHPQRRDVHGPTSVTLGRSFRPIAPRVSVSTDGASLAVLQAKSVQPKVPVGTQHGERRAALMAGCFYIFNAPDGDRTVRLIGPDGGQPSENAGRQAVAWLRQHAYLLPRCSAIITVIASSQDDPTPLDRHRPGYKVFNVSETVTVAFSVGEQQRLNLPKTASSEASNANVPSPNVAGNAKSVFVVQALDSRGQQQQQQPLTPAGSSNAQPVVLSNIGGVQRVSTKPVCSVAPLRNSTETSGSSFDQLLAYGSPKATSSTLESSPASTSAPIAVCDQAIVVLAANQVFVGDTGCYIMNSSPGNVVTSQTPTASTSAAIGSSGSNNRGVQIIQVVPQVVVASSSETGLAPSAVTYNTGSTPNAGQPH